MVTLLLILLLLLLLPDEKALTVSTFGLTTALGRLWKGSDDVDIWLILMGADTLTAVDRAWVVFVEAALVEAKGTSDAAL